MLFLRMRSDFAVRPVRGVVGAKTGLRLVTTGTIPVATGLSPVGIAWLAFVRGQSRVAPGILSLAGFRGFA